ncbi:MAG: hypothetical protein ACOY46_14235 [Bacillota bacterium]
MPKKMVAALLLLILPFCLIFTYYLLSQIYTTLPVTAVTESDRKAKNLGYSFNSPEVGWAYEQWRKKNTWNTVQLEMESKNIFPFPLYSPDGRFYVDMRYIPSIRLWVMDMYSTYDNKKLGSFASHKIDFMGWRPDSSGVFVKRLGYKSGYGSWTFFIPRINFDGPRVVALVPEKDYNNSVFRGEPMASPNKEGWYNADVNIHFTALKPGVKVLTPDIVIKTEGWGQGVTGTAEDGEGKKWSYSVADINIDKTLPAITVEVPAEGTSYPINERLYAKWDCKDELSGISSTKASVSYGMPIDTSTAGEKTFTLEVTDNAGNMTVKTVKYYVR